MEEDDFKIESIKNAAHFTGSLLIIADHVQMKYNSEVGEAIWTLTKPVFNYPPMPKETKVGEDGNTTIDRINELGMKEGKSNGLVFRNREKRLLEMMMEPHLIWILKHNMQYTQMK